MMTRVRPIFSAQVGNANNYLSDGLLWAEGYHGNVSNLWYGGGGAAYYDSTSNPADTNPATMTAYFAGLPSPAFTTAVSTDSTWTRAYGLKNIAYEGGPGPGGSPLGGVTGTDATSYAYNNDPRMKDRMLAAHDIWVEKGGDMLVYYIYSGPAPWSFTNGASGAVVSDTTSVKMQAIDAIKAGASPAPSLGTLVPATVYLRDAAAKVISTEGGVSTWKYSGTAWQLVKHATDVNKNTFLLLPVRTTAAGNYKVSYTSYDSVATESVDVFVNGVLQGAALANTGAAGTAVKSQEITVALPEGISVFRLRVKVAPQYNEVWLKDLIVEPA